MAPHFYGTPVNRRAVLRGSTLGALGLFAGGAALSACGDSGQNGAAPAPSTATAAPPAADVKGSATYLNYPGWIGPDTVADFEMQFPGAQIKQSASGFDSSVGVAGTIAQNPKEYDLAYVTRVMAQQMEAGQLILHVDEKSVPSLSNVEPKIRELFPYGVCIDTAVSCIAYRKDLVDEPLTSWADFWRLAPKYSGKVTFIGNDTSAIGVALMYCGFDPNSNDSGELDKAKKALLQLKPHIQAFKVSDLAKGLQDGSAVMSSGWSYEMAAAAVTDPNIVVVSPKDGSLASIEGVVAIAQTDVPNVALAWLDFIMQPKQYADFVNATSAARTSTAADSMINKDLLTPAFDYPDNAIVQNFTGADGVKLRSRVWAEVQAG